MSMSAEMFPSGPDPLTLEAGRASRFTPFTEALGPAPDGSPGDGMVVLVARSGPPVTAATPDPRFRIRASGGDAVAVERYPQGTEVLDRDGNPLGEVDYRAAIGGVYEIELFIAKAGSSWELEIANTDSVPRTFAWAASATVAGATRPWVVVAPDHVELAAETEATDVRTLKVENHGTGPLMVAAPRAIGPSLTGGLLGGAGPDGPDGPVVAPGAAIDLQVTFSPPAGGVDGVVETRYVVECDDGETTRTHRTVTVRARTDVPPPAEVEVAFLAIAAPNGARFRRAIEDDRMLAAMSAVCGVPRLLGTMIYPGTGVEPLHGTDFQRIVDAYRALLPSGFPVYSRATWVHPAGRPAQPPDAVLSGRRDFARAITSFAQRGALDPGPVSVAMEDDAFKIAREAGIPQPVIMVVEIVIGPVVDSVGTAHPGDPNSLTGRNLMLDGDPLPTVLSEFPSNDERDDRGTPSDPNTTTSATATRVDFVQGEVHTGSDSITGRIFVQRADGTQSTGIDSWVPIL
jgi:hypothetical protein